MRTSTALFAIAWLAAANGSAQDDAAKERERVQGNWNFVSVEMDGKNLDQFEGAKAVVKGDRVTVMFKQGFKIVRTFKVFPDTNPRCVDFLDADGKGDASEGIYELKDNRLKVLVRISRDGGKERPTDFADKGKKGHILYVLERQE
jgi:uncharacterized protein (TIGR03067 family)